MSEAAPTGYQPYWIYLIATGLGLLGVSIILTNSFLIGFYLKKYREIVPWMYIMIAACDTVTGFTAICHAGIATAPKYGVAALIGNPEFWKRSPSSDLFLNSLYIISQTGTRTSLFYNTVLTVVRTLNIRQPFYQLKKKIMIVFIIFYPVLWFVLLIVDLYLSITSANRLGFVYNYVIDNVFAAFPGAGFIIAFPQIVDLNHDLLKYYGAIVVILFMVVPLVLPAITALVCAVLQIHSLLKPSVISPATSKERRMTVTIIMLTVVCLVCNVPYTALMIYISVTAIVTKEYAFKIPLSQQLCIFYTLSTLLPFINAILSPMILVVRGASLRRCVGDTVRRLFSRRPAVINNAEGRGMEMIANAGGT